MVIVRDGCEATREATLRALARSYRKVDDELLGGSPSRMCALLRGPVCVSSAAAALRGKCFALCRSSSLSPRGLNWSDRDRRWL